jgi:hypothetical protein
MAEWNDPAEYPLPAPITIVRLAREFTEVEISTYYRGKTNAYVVERTSLLAILDKTGRRPAPCPFTSTRPGSTTTTKTVRSRRVTAASAGCGMTRKELTRADDDVGDELVEPRRIELLTS